MFKIDFSIIIAVLVLVQLYILGMNVNDGSKSDKESKEDCNIETLTEQVEDSTEAVQGGVSLVVHRNNGEEVVYKKSNVA